MLCSGIHYVSEKVGEGLLRARRTYAREEGRAAMVNKGVEREG